MNGRPLADRMKGRWRDALRALGVEERFLVNRNGPCPMCGGTDRYRFDDKDGRGTWFCSQCGGPGKNGGAGNGIDLFMRITDSDFHDTACRLEAIYPDLREEGPKRERSEDDLKRAMNALWRSGRRLTGEDLASRYLLSRVGAWPYTPELRFAEKVTYTPKEDGARQSVHPAMLARVTAADGTPANVHRTYLAPKGGKAQVRDPKRVMPGPLPPGCAIRLAAPTDVLVVAEGIETALACTALWDLPSWSLISAGNMEKWSPPEGVKRVVIGGDGDESFTGQAAAYALAKRLVRDGFEVDPRIPDAGDWCDVFDSQRSAERAA